MSNYHYHDYYCLPDSYSGNYYLRLDYSYSKLGVIEPSDVTESSDSQCAIEVSADLSRWRIAFMWLVYGLRFGFQHPGIQRLQVN